MKMNTKKAFDRYIEKLQELFDEVHAEANANSKVTFDLTKWNPCDNTIMPEAFNLATVVVRLKVTPDPDNYVVDAFGNSCYKDVLMDGYAIKYVNLTKDGALTFKNCWNVDFSKDLSKYEFKVLEAAGNVND